MIDSTVTRFELLDAEAIPTPIARGVRIELDEEGEPFEWPYSKVVDVLLYLANTARPDISFAVAR